MKRKNQSPLFLLLRWSPRPLSRVPRTRLCLKSHKRHQRKRKGLRMRFRTMVKIQRLFHLSKILNLMLQLRRKVALRPMPPTLSNASRKRRNLRSYQIIQTLRTSRSYSQLDQRTSQKRKKSIQILRSFSVRLTRKNTREKISHSISRSRAKNNQGLMMKTQKMEKTSNQEANFRPEPEDSRYSRKSLLKISEVLHVDI